MKGDAGGHRAATEVVIFTETGAATGRQWGGNGVATKALIGMAMTAVMRVATLFP